MSEIIEQLVKLRGIETSYVDAWGKPAEVVPTSKVKILKALGYAVDEPEQLARQYQADVVEYWTQLTPAVQVRRSGTTLQVELRVSIDQANQELTCTIATESGKKVKSFIKASDGELTAVHTIDGIEFHSYMVDLSVDVELGYHELSLTKKGGRKVLGSGRFIVAPQKAFIQPAIAEGQKVWGPSVQLYCLKTENNWGIGDFTDLRYLVEQVAANGGDFVGLNPIHALYPANPDTNSPYSPSSRRWLNVSYIDVTAVEEFLGSEAEALVATEDFQAKLKQARDTDLVDYSLVTELKLAALKLVYKKFSALKKTTKRAKAFKAFQVSGGESLEAQAIYDALQSHLYQTEGNAWGWPVWPEQFRSFDLPAVAEWASENRDSVDFYAWLQWLADVQLEAVDQAAKASGMAMGIYRDLAVGVSEGSVEIWSNGNLYANDLSVGAPPDILGPLGQKWGLPPMDPKALEDLAYQPMIELFRSNMRSCGALRIDHAMALLRLWLVPLEDSADKGAYLYYPIHDLLGILALESHRNECLIIGEDLGTVPEGIFEVLQENGVHSYRLFFFEQAEDGGFVSPAHYPEQAMSAITTHDMPTLRGYWHCDDLQLGRELGLYPDKAVLQQLYQDRHEAKQKILDSLHGHQSLPDSISHDVNWVGMDEELNFGMQVHMAKGSCNLLSLQLEDWMQMDKPVNVPGTFNEYPNWRRKLDYNLEQLFANESVLALMKSVTAARREASK